MQEADLRLSTLFQDPATKTTTDYLTIFYMGDEQLKTQTVYHVCTTSKMMTAEFQLVFTTTSITQVSLCTYIYTYICKLHDFTFLSNLLTELKLDLKCRGLR